MVSPVGASTAAPAGVMPWATHHTMQQQCCGQ
jgi:hypothetical protein